MVRLACIGVEFLRTHDLRFTEGESLLHRGLEDTITQYAVLVTDEGRHPDIALTADALGLDERTHFLAKAGLDRVNISLDTLDSQHYAQITCRDQLRDAFTELDAVAKAGLRPIRVSAVILRGISDTDLFDLLGFHLDRGIELRVIEQILIDLPSAWDR